MILWPAIDILEGSCVRLTKGAYDSAKVYSSDPVEVAQGFADQGATHLHVVDLSRAKDPQKPFAQAIPQICRQTHLSVQVGGGVRSQKDFEDLLETGVKRVVIGSLAIRNPQLVRTLIDQNPQSVILAVDILPSSSQGWEVAIEAWSEGSKLHPFELIRQFTNLKGILCTDISRDGCLSGANQDLYGELKTEFPSLEVLASGGISGTSDLVELQRQGLDGVIIGKALYEGRFTLKEGLECLPIESFPV